MARCQTKRAQAEFFFSEDLLTEIPHAAHFLPNLCRNFCQKGTLTTADTYNGQKLVSVLCLLPLSSSSLELTDVFLSST